MKWDWTISIGTVIHLVGMLLGVIALYYKLVARITRIEDAHLNEARGIIEIKDELKDLKRGWVTELEKRVRNLEIQQGPRTA